MRKLTFLCIAVVLSMTITWLVGCGEDEESEEPSGSGVSYLYPGNGASDVPTTTSILVIYTEDILTPSMANLSFTPGVSGAVSYDPDSLTLIFKPSAPLSGNTEYTMNIDGSDLKQITDYKGIDFTPQFSPDGKKIIFTSQRSGNDDLWVYNSETKEFKQLTTYEAKDFSPAYSPDGSLVAFVCGEINSSGEEKFKANGVKKDIPRI